MIRKSQYVLRIVDDVSVAKSHGCGPAAVQAFFEETKRRFPTLHVELRLLSFKKKASLWSLVGDRCHGV